jgi:hypothetical protein
MKKTVNLRTRLTSWCAACRPHRSQPKIRVSSNLSREVRPMMSTV